MTFRRRPEPCHDRAPQWAIELVERVAHISHELEHIMAALDDLQAADTSLQAKVSEVLADFATALQNAGTDPAAIEAVVTDLNNMSAQLAAADPAAAPAPPAEPSA